MLKMLPIWRGLTSHTMPKSAISFRGGSSLNSLFTQNYFLAISISLLNSTFSRWLVKAVILEPYLMSINFTNLGCFLSFFDPFSRSSSTTPWSALWSGLLYLRHTGKLWKRKSIDPTEYSRMSSYVEIGSYIRGLGVFTCIRNTRSMRHCTFHASSPWH